MVNMTAKFGTKFHFDWLIESDMSGQSFSGINKYCLHSYQSKRISAYQFVKV